MVKSNVCGFKMKRKINTDINNDNDNDNDNDNQKQMKHSDRQRQDNPTMTSGHAASAFHLFRKKNMADPPWENGCANCAHP